MVVINQSEVTLNNFSQNTSAVGYTYTYHIGDDLYHVFFTILVDLPVYHTVLRYDPHQCTFHYYYIHTLASYNI